MNVFLFFSMDKDRGYAWIILGASTVLMCIGPSTYSSFGFLTSDIPLRPDLQLWLLNVLYSCWLISAFLAAILSKGRPRQLATTGAAVAAIGFLISASIADDPSWLYLTFSLFIGFGLGLSFHTAYLVTMSNFDRYKGLANGVCQLSIAIGQITTPILFTIVSLPRDRFQIKALTTAVGFLTTLFFVVPTHTSQQTPYIGDRNRRYSGASRKNSRSEAVPLQLQSSSNSIPIGQGRPRRRSMYLLAVSTSLLPNIPEEPETTASMNDTLTSSESEIQASLASQSAAILSSNVEILNETEEELGAPLPEELGGTSPTTIKSELQDNVVISNERESVETKPKRERRKSEGCEPSYIGNYGGTKQLTNGVIKTLKTTPVEVEQERRNSESQLQSKTSLNSMVVEQKSDKKKEGTQNSTNAIKSGQTGESIIDFSLLQDFHFLNMAAFSALCTVTVVNFPVVLYAYIITVCKECTDEASIAMLIIYIVDLISRLVISYLSDFAFMGHRTGFLFGCALGGTLIAVTSLVDDILLIYCICVAYGVCVGMLTTSEYLIYMESFGLERFQQAYGFANLFKLIVVTVLGFFVGNPLSVYFYPIHPLDQQAHTRNISLFSDALGFSDTASQTPTVRPLINVAVPSILCALAWIIEDIYKATHKCSAHRKLSSPITVNTDVPCHNV